MSEVIVLSILKFAALLVGFTSSVWGMLKKTTEEDEHGKKKLTAAGQISVALAGFSFLIAASAYGFQTLVKQEKARAAAENRERLAAKQFRRDQVTAITAMQTNAIKIKQAQDSILSQKNDLDARFRQLKAYAEERSRDARLSRSVGLANRKNLQQINSAIDGIDRLLKPYGAFSGYVDWGIMLDNKAPILRADSQCVGNPKKIITVAGSDLQGKTATVVLSDREPELQYRTSSPAIVLKDRNIRSLLSGVESYINFTKSPAALPKPIGEMSGDLSWTARRNSTSFTYYCSIDMLLINMDIAEDSPFKTTGEVASINDLQEATLHISFKSGNQAILAENFQIRMLAFGLKTEGREYWTELDEWKQYSPGSPPLTFRTKLQQAK